MGRATFGEQIHDKRVKQAREARAQAHVQRQLSGLGGPTHGRALQLVDGRCRRRRSRSIALVARHGVRGGLQEEQRAGSLAVAALLAGAAKVA